MEGWRQERARRVGAERVSDVSELQMNFVSQKHSQTHLPLDRRCIESDASSTMSSFELAPRF